jgi:TolB-like protein/Flp pilus assembly protein TadD
MEDHAGMSIRPSPVDPAPSRIHSPGSRAHRRRWVWMLAAVPVAAALTAAGSWWHARAASAQIRSIAVLPFLDMFHASDQDWFGDGITDEIIDGLARIPGLRVAAHTSAFAFKNQPRDLHRIGEQLGVAAVLEGSIQKDGGRLRLTAQLHRTDDGYQLWSVTIDRPANDAFGLQREMVRALAGRIRAGAGPRFAPHQSSPEAYDVYLEGRALFGRAGSESVTKAAERFADATRLDSDFSLAWAWQSIANEYRVDDGLVRSNEAMPAARDAAERAVALDADSGDAHLALGIVKLQYDWDWNTAKQEFDRALQLSPGSSFALHWLAHWYETQGRLDEALTGMRAALTFDPLSPEMLRDVVSQRLATANPAGALPFAQIAADLFPNDPQAKSSLIGALFYAGQKEEARRLTGDLAPSIQAAFWSAVEGDSGDARNLLDQGDDLHAEQQAPAMTLAGLAAAAENWDRLFYWLNIAYDERSVHLPYARLDRRIPQSDPRFGELLDRMNLPPALPH